MTVELVLAAVLLTMILTLLGGWLSLDRRHISYLLVGVATAAVCVLFRFNDFSMTGQDMVVLQAGLSDLNIAHIFGGGNHFCLTCAGFSDAVAALGGSRLPIQDTIAANRVLFILNIAGLAVVALVITRNYLLSVFYAIGAAMVPVVQLGFDSNYPAAFLMTLFLSGILCGAVFQARERVGRVLAVLAVATLAFITVAAFYTRPETAAPGLAAVGMMVLTGRRLPAVVKPRSWFPVALAAVVVMGLLEAASLLLRKSGFPVWLIDGINPADPSTAMAVLDIVIMLPLSMAILVFIGVWQTVKHPGRFLLLPLSMIFLLKTYASASRFDLHTIFRMFAVLTPMLLLVGLWGLRAVLDLLAARMPDRKLRILVSVLIIASFGVNTSFVRRFIRVDKPSGGPVAGLEQPDSMLSMNPQLEVRFVSQALDSHPDCVFMSRVIDRETYGDMNSGRSPGAFVDVWFSRSGVSRNPPASLPECVLFYRSLDCNIYGQNDCDGLLAGAHPVREISFLSRPYGNYVLPEYEQPIVLGLYVRPQSP